ncbi:MAG: hypothetical protein ACAI44_28585 [Candidatus Sericytochromatia bacterium]
MMMSKFFTLTTILATAMMMSACGRAQVPGAAFHSQPTRVVSAQDAGPVQLIVRFNKNVTRMALQAFNQKYQLRTVNYLSQLDAYIMVPRAPLASQAALQAMISHMQQEPVANLVEINHEIQVAPVPYDMSTMPVLGE